MAPNTLNIFLAVVFITAPTVFRIVRGLTLDIKTRDYVAAAQTRGERPWYIMMWEILPNARGPLIVDACLRIGYTTILLGTLGFFGLGVSPRVPDWGSTINEGRKLLRVYVHPALPPALALMSLVLGLNLLADALREQTHEGLTASHDRTPPRHRQPVDLLLHPRRRDPGGDELLRQRRARRGPRPRRRVRAAASRPWRSPSCATSAATAGSSAARSASRAATSSPCPTPSCARSAARRSR